MTTAAASRNGPSGPFHGAARTRWPRSSSTRARHASLSLSDGHARHVASVMVARRPLYSAASSGVLARSSRLRDALDERAVFDEDDAGLGSALRHGCVLGVGGQSLPVALVRGETREIDQGKAGVGGSRNLRPGAVAD